MQQSPSLVWTGCSTCSSSHFSSSFRLVMIYYFIPAPGKNMNIFVVVFPNHLLHLPYLGAICALWARPHSSLRGPALRIKQRRARSYSAMCLFYHSWSAFKDYVKVARSRMERPARIVKMKPGSRVWLPLHAESGASEEASQVKKVTCLPSGSGTGYTNK